jgi:type II secretory pathway pseudopilin PulG
MGQDGMAVEMRAEKRLSITAKVLLSLGIVLAVGLVVMTGLVLQRRRVEKEKERQTQAVLAELRTLVDFNRRPPPDDTFFSLEGLAGPVTTDEPDDAVGQVQLRRESGRDTEVCEWHSGSPPEEWLLQRGNKTLSLDASCRNILRSPRQAVLDAWGNPIRYRSPGPIHRHGWDLYSVGPNGIDERGQGDDIIVGEDVAEIGSVR